MNILTAKAAEAVLIAEAEYLSALPSPDACRASAALAEEIPFTDTPEEEAIPFAVQIDGQRLAPILAYDNAGTWLDILTGHFPEADAGIVLA